MDIVELQAGLDETKPDNGLPKGIFPFVTLLGIRHQIAIAGLAILSFACGTAPLEIQRRIVNDTVEGASLSYLISLVLIYLAVTFAEGLAKLLLNLYRTWLAEAAIRWLRELFLVKAAAMAGKDTSPSLAGVELSIVLSEAEPVGGIAATIVAEPLLQGGILVAVTGYMIFLQPLMTLVVALTFFPQATFVPVIQRMINRLVETRITLMRSVSEGLVETFDSANVLHEQKARTFAVFSTNMGIYRLKFMMNFLMNYMTQLGYAGIFLLGGYYVLTGRTEMGTVVAFVSGLSKITDPWGELVDWYRDLKVTQVKYELIRGVAGPIDPGTLRRARPRLFGKREKPRPSARLKA
ncbi:ABC transporter ATP-binding protein [Rhizobium sp. BK376]|uniref:ABC transporter ATP-binding protein n=1 Tax=Rhizobium sp. BK376 TaxID=2512149 RepID=UPI0010F168E9|nr:ABC transporter ATP-binding protein [Rhizobium sp. BK376]TCR75623.1 hypothetical protein EV561_12262 [Rhizobium sp. BK376]